jgi:hypothetical protein
LPFVSYFNNTSKYETDVEDFVVSLISSSFGYIESTWDWNWLMLIDKMSSIYRNVELKATAIHFSFHASLVTSTCWKLTLRVVDPQSFLLSFRWICSTRFIHFSYWISVSKFLFLQNDKTEPKSSRYCSFLHDYLIFLT